MGDVLSFYLYVIFFVNLFLGFFYLFVFVKLKLRKNEGTTQKNLDITFVIPAHNCEKTIEKAVYSINNSDYPTDLIKIIVVNDGSIDKTLEVCRKLEKLNENVSVINKKNTGKADSLNAGIKKARSELVAILDSDTIVKKDLLKKAVAKFSEESVYAVTSRLVPIRRKNFLERMQGIEYTFTAFYRKIVNHLKSLPAAPAFTVFRRVFFVKHGYFDKNNLTEDFEIGLRVMKNHYDIGFVSDSYAMTEVPDSIKKLYRQRIRWHYGALFNYRIYRRMFFKKEYGDLSMFVLPSGLAIILISAASFLITIYNFIDYSFRYSKLLLNGWVPNFEFDIYNDLILLTDLRLMLIATSLVLGFCFYLFVKSEINVKMPLSGYMKMVFIYLPLQAFFYLIAFMLFVSGRKPDW